MPAAHRIRPGVLIVLDGYGIAPMHEGNAIARAKTPVMDRLIRTYPAMTIRAAGEAVGLAWGEMGNSEVGHLSIGAGRVFYQNRPRIEKEIQQGTFFENAAFRSAVAHVQRHQSRLHILGLVSPGGVHSHQDHCFALLEFAKRQKVDRVYIHAILDGRDAHYRGGAASIRELRKRCHAAGVGEIATLMGRYYAMDRDHRWDRTAKAYQAMVDGVGPTADDPLRAIAQSYDRKVYDEEFVPTVLTKGGKPIAMIHDGDAVISFNFRADRARQLTHAFVDPTCKDFARGERVRDLAFVTLMEYEHGLPVEVAFPPEPITACLAKSWSAATLKQLHIAETEKYAHVTFFMNGMREEPFAGEERVLIPSPKVASYDFKPEMSAGLIAARVVKELSVGAFDGYVVNFANPDMVGHTGNVEATIAAVEATDAAVGKVVDATLKAQGVVVVTADHGNAEELVNLETQEMDKEHATNPVPLIACARELEGKTNPDLEALGWDAAVLTPVGILADVAPTLLALMGITSPEEMTGQPLIAHP